MLTNQIFTPLTAVTKWKYSKYPKWRHLFHKYELLILVSGMVFWMMVVLGLAMEFKGSHKAKEITDRENARLNVEAGEARKEAGEAIERAGKANQLASAANERATRLESTNLVTALQIEVLRMKNSGLEAKARHSIHQQRAG